MVKVEGLVAAYTISPTITSMTRITHFRITTTSAYRGPDQCEYPKNLTAERLHLRQHSRRLGFQRLSLRRVVRLRILTCLVLEVEVAEVLIDNLLALAQIIQPRFLRHRSQSVLRPEDIRAAGKQQKNWRKQNREVHRHRSLAAAQATARSRVKGIVYLRCA